MAHLQAANYGQLQDSGIKSASLDDFKKLIQKAISFSSISWAALPMDAHYDHSWRSSALQDGVARTIAIGGRLNHTVIIEYAVWEKRQALRTNAKVTIMSAFRKDLFVSVTLPLLIAAIGAFAIIWTAYAHIDTKLDTAKSEASSGLDHLGDTLRQELRADREARSKEFETLRVEMREDRKDARDAIKELTNRS